MAVKRVEPDEASKLIEQGYSYLDVRSQVEFEQGHPAGAFNIPLMHMEPGRGMVANPGYLEEVQAAFAADSQIVVGCKSGGRSAHAAAMMAEAGFCDVIDMRAGYGGEIAEGGRVTCPGWVARGLPTSTVAQSGRSYSELKTKD